jgi:hypothetical protein
MEYAHWLIVVGAVLLVLGFIGFALHKNDAEPAEGHLTPDTSSETIPAAESFAASCRDQIFGNRIRSKCAAEGWQQAAGSSKAERTDGLQTRRNGQGHQAMGWRLRSVRA